MTRTTKIWIGVGVFAVLAALSHVNPTAHREPTAAEMLEQTVAAYGTTNEAQTKGETFVKRVLKSPTTARFSEQVEKRTEAVWYVGGSVDSQNSYGAMIRSRYQCAIRKDGDRWVIVMACEVRTVTGFPHTTKALYYGVAVLIVVQIVKAIAKHYLWIPVACIWSAGVAVSSLLTS